jgi:hypothetical protein
MDKLYQVKDRVLNEIEEYADKGKLSANDAMTLKALTGSADHLCNIIDKADEGHSSMYPYAYTDGMDNRSYRRSYRGDGRSYAQRRDSMGRYSGRGYSRHGLTDKLRDLMEEAPDENTRMEIQRLVDKME